MKRPSPSIEAQVRHAFELLLEIRSQPAAANLLAQANAFLKMLVQGADTQSHPVVITVQAVRIRES